MCLILFNESCAWYFSIKYAFHKYFYYPNIFETGIDQQEVASKNVTLTNKIFIHICEHLVSARTKNYNETIYSFAYACLKLILYDNILFQIMLNKLNITFLKVLNMEKQLIFYYQIKFIRRKQFKNKLMCEQFISCLKHCEPNHVVFNLKKKIIFNTKLIISFSKKKTSEWMIF